MSEPSGPSEQLARSWDRNASAWTRAVREGLIESRRLATDAAIMETITSLSPRSILDAGCGEGWLCRAAEVRGIRAVGLDGSAELIEAARQAGEGEYHHLRYGDLGELTSLFDSETFDVAVFNFSLLDEKIEGVLRHVARVVRPDGRLVIQTVHPWTGAGDGPYTDGWRTEDFATFTGAFRETMPWYFRTLASLSRDIRNAGLEIDRLIEPRHPDTGEPVSLIVVAAPLTRGARGSRPADPEGGGKRPATRVHR